MAKPRKVEEPVTPYTATPKSQAKADTAPQIRYIEAKTARRLTKQIFDKHHELFRKLAQ